MTDDLLTIITDAAAKERARRIPKNFDATCAELCSTTPDGERAVALAILKAISEAGLAVVPVHSRPFDYDEDVVLAGENAGADSYEDAATIFAAMARSADLIPAMLAAAPDVLE